MKERGMIFSGLNVRANLDGRKGQTRRTRELKQVNENPNRWMLDMFDPNMGIARFVTDRRHGHGLQCFAKCPYGVPGDTFYMRERIDNGLQACNFYYHADNKGVGNRIYKNLCDYGLTLKKTIPSIHMPKWAARPERFEITDIRVERVRDTSKEDAKAEGVHWLPRKTGYQHCFMDLWNKINLKRGYGWQMNPWVWVVCYRKQEL